MVFLPSQALQNTLIFKGSFFSRKEFTASGSLSKLAYRRFLKNRLAMAAMIYIILATVVAILGYLITPDSTPFANRQHLELAIRKPGFRVTMVMLRREMQESDKSTFPETMISGRRHAYTLLPVAAHRVTGDSVFVTPYTGDENFIAPEQAFHSSDVLGFRQQTYLLGTDQFGRDVLSRIMIGTRVSLSVGLISVFISLFIGILVGSLGGFFRGWVDNMVMWLINVIWAVPTLLLVIAITFALGKGFWQIFVAVGLTMWVEVARVVRGQILSIREKEFVEAGRAMGFSSFRIIVNHILPNVMGPVIVIAAANFASAILIEAGLSFLGIGVQPPMPSWGSMIKENYAYIILDAAYLAILPGLAIMLIVLAFMVIGNALRDAMDVKMVTGRE